MGRPPKKGLDYFPLDVYPDDKIKLIEAEHGLEGFAILIKLYQKIYANSYYVEWEDDNILLFSTEINSDINTVNTVINSCFRRNLFDLSMYEKHKILTSKGIQERYISACESAKRRKIEIDKLHNLLDKMVCSEKSIVSSGVNEDNSGKIQKEPTFTHEESAQIKEKKIKENKRKENKKEEGNNAASVFSAYEKYINSSVSPAAYETLKSYLDDGIEPELICQAIYKANDEGKKGISYIRGILNNCLSKGILTADQFKSDNAERNRLEKTNGERALSEIKEYMEGLDGD